MAVAWQLVDNSKGMEVVLEGGRHVSRGANGGAQNGLEIAEVNVASVLE